MVGWLSSRVASLRGERPVSYFCDRSGYEKGAEFRALSGQVLAEGW